MTPRARLLFWDYPRGSVAYDVVCVLLALLVLLVPGSWWADPMVPLR